MLAVKQVTVGTGRAVTVACAGADVYNKTGGATTLTLSLQAQGVLLEYNSGIWMILADDLPMSQLDARYANLASPRLPGRRPHRRKPLVDSTTKIATDAFVATALNTRAQVFSPIAYGAVGNGVADDTTAVQNCVAAATAVGGVVDLGYRTFKTSAPITTRTDIYIRGSQPGGGGIVNSASDIFTVPAGGQYSARFENCTFTSNAGGGHIWNASSGPSLSHWTITNCLITQNNPAKCIWYQNNGLFIWVLVNGNSQMTCSASATVSPWTVLNVPGAANANKFIDLTIDGHAAPVPFFLFDQGYSAHTDTNVGMTAGSPNVTDANAVAADVGLSISSTNFPGNVRLSSRSLFSHRVRCQQECYGYPVRTDLLDRCSWRASRGLIFDNVSWEVCSGGAISVTGMYDVLINECANWDIPAAGLGANFYSFATSNTGPACSNIRVTGGMPGGASTTGSGFSDVYADANTTNIHLDTFGLNTTPVISSPPAQTTITNQPVASVHQQLRSPARLRSRAQRVRQRVGVMLGPQ